MSFDCISANMITRSICLNPFRSGQCLSTHRRFIMFGLGQGLNPFRSGQCLSTSFTFIYYCYCYVSIPFDQGNVFRHSRTIKKKGDPLSQSLSIRAMSFDNLQERICKRTFCLNPFRSGQCLSTKDGQQVWVHPFVSIPFDQGNVFRHYVIKWKS